MNYQIFGLCTLLRQLWFEEAETQQRIAVADYARQQGGLDKTLGLNITPDHITDEDCTRAEGWLKYAKTQADQLELQAVHDRIDLFTRKIRMRMRLHDYLAEVRALREAFESGINFKYFYRYPQAKALILLKVEPEWKKITDAFPDCKEEVVATVDCYALGHATASVFHSMRIAEHGLRAIAHERKIKLGKNKPVEWGTWQDIIKELDKEITAIGGKKAGKAKDAALEFYSGARADLNGFKDEYRNLVMHVRAKYDDLQAQRALQKVYGFMERISSKIDHHHHRIRWGLK